MKDTPIQDKLDFIGFWILKQQRDPAEELVHDHLKKIIESIELANESEIYNFKLILYLIETGNAEIVEPRANESDPIVFNENLIKAIQLMAERALVDESINSKTQASLKPADLLLLARFIGR